MTDLTVLEGPPAKQISRLREKLKTLLIIPVTRWRVKGILAKLSGWSYLSFNCAAAAEAELGNLLLEPVEAGQ